MQSTVANHSRHHTLGNVLRRTAKRFPHRPAIICGATSWTYVEFDDICNRVASGFAGFGIGKGDRIAILARNSHAFAAVRFAAARLGAVLVPINFMLNAEEVNFILGHSGATTLCVDSGLVETARTAVNDTRVRNMFWLPGEEPSAPAAGLLDFNALTRSAPDCPDNDFDASAAAQIVYTSGTESHPKGALLTHDAILWEYVSCLADAEIAEADLILHALPLYHCAQLDVFLGPGIYVGATNVITGKPTADNILHLLDRYRISSFFAPPTIWISLLRSPHFDATDLTALAKGYYGASIMPVEVLKEIQRRLPKVRLWNLYGQTEIAPVATVLKPEDQLRKAGSAGRPALNVETRIVDDDMNDVPCATVGEIVHRSPQLMSEYFNDPERTQAAFEGGWFHSGDLGVVDEEGYITIVDRKKDMIKTGGENVASREVEESLYRLEGISEVAVIGIPDPVWIEAVTAVVVVKAGFQLDEGTVIAHAREHLAHFKVPKKVVFIEAMPRNPSGKLLKKDLRLMLSKPNP
jgi:fatty-acyl-CoA synthase